MKNSRKDRISYFSDFRLCVSVTKKKKKIQKKKMHFKGL